MIAGPKPEPPRRIQMADCTLEALGKHLNCDANPGVVHFHDELMSFYQFARRLPKERGRKGSGAVAVDV